jgi:hypothetical protein
VIRYPLWKLVFLLVLGPPAVAGWWYAYVEFKGVPFNFHIDGMFILMVFELGIMFVICLIPSVVCGTLATMTVYWTVRRYQRRRQTQSVTTPDQ